MDKELHAKCDTTRLNVPRKRGGRVLICREDCVRTEELSAGWYIKNSNEEMLRKVDEKQIVQGEKAGEAKRYKSKCRQLV